MQCASPTCPHSLQDLAQILSDDYSLLLILTNRQKTDVNTRYKQCLLHGSLIEFSGSSSN